MRSMHWHAEWPSADEKHELQSLKAKICRRSVLGSLYFMWVCGITGVAIMGAYSLYAITRSVLSLNTIPVPRSVAYFLTFLVLYETYHWLTPGLHRWDAMRRFLHYMFTKYPYFRRTVCLFDEELDANAIKNKGDNAPASRQVPSDSSDADSFFVKPDDKSLFAFHPHGILSCGFGMNGIHHTKFAKSNTRWLVAENLFWFPIMRDLLHWMDSSNVKKETFIELMKKNQNIGFLPGGFEDATLYKRGTHRVFIKNRFGFIKLALQFGYKVYPVYTFGEEHTFDALPYFLHLRLKLNAFKLPGAIFMGSPWCFFMPRSNVDLVTVVGKPLELPTIKHPTKQDVQKYHVLYVSSLHALFEKHKAKYAVDPDATLEMY